MKSLTSFREVLVRLVLGKLLPNRMKRLFLISSLHAKINAVSKPDRAIAQKLNQTMALGSDPESLIFPMKLGNKFWKNNSLEVEVGNTNQIKIHDLAQITTTNLTKAQVRIVADQILKIVPVYLMYDSKRKMKQDITQLLASFQPNAQAH